MLPNGLRTRMLKSFQHLCERAVASPLQQMRRSALARVVARACQNPSKTSGFVATSKPNVHKQSNTQGFATS
eukprot:8752205-Pyramimonas_sp.AAC.1